MPYDPSLVREIYLNDSRPTQSCTAPCDWEECTTPNTPAPLWVLPVYGMPDGYFHWLCRALYYRKEREKLGY
jgi:hypothetical protein